MRGKLDRGREPPSHVRALGKARPRLAQWPSSIPSTRVPRACCGRVASASASSPRRHSRQGCCSPQDPATTGPNDACAVAKGGLRKQGADRPARRQREGAWRSSAVLLAHERRTLNRPFAPRVELSLGLCEDLQTTAAARSRRASVAHAAVAVARDDRDLTVAPHEEEKTRVGRRARPPTLLQLVLSISVSHAGGDFRNSLAERRRGSGS